MNEILLGNCLEVFKDQPAGCVDLAICDPPFNIGYKYDDYKDNLNYKDYVNWTNKWLAECNRLLKDNSSIYVVIGGEYQAEVCVLMKRYFSWRNTIIWRYGFGQNTNKKYSRCHTYVHYFVKGQPVFNDKDIRVPSIRHTKYKDKRASPLGKVPEDTYSDFMEISRVCGTFNERVKDKDGVYSCQLPEELVSRFIRASSNPEDLILDMFSGSGTVAAVAHKLKRKYMVCDISSRAIEMTKQRIL